jgi:hypothetical protein
VAGFITETSVLTPMDGADLFFLVVSGVVFALIAVGVIISLI